MLGLRWTLGIVTALVTLMILAIAVVGGGFRRSFGASHNPIPTVLTLVVSTLVLASLVWPEQRALMHLVAVLMLALVAGSLFLMRESLGTAMLGVAYAAAWLSLYYRLVRA
jgi:hypothetical protein